MESQNNPADLDAMIEKLTRAKTLLSDIYKIAVRLSTLEFELQANPSKYIKGSDNGN